MTDDNKQVSGNYNSETGKIEYEEVGASPKAICAVCGESFGGQYLAGLKGWLMIHPECENDERCRRNEFVAPMMRYLRDIRPDLFQKSHDPSPANAPEDNPGYTTQTR